jgi:exopolyphosphatase/pppGpp-phosphohydrolase
VLAAPSTPGAEQLTVSSRGLREGVALHEVSDELPSPSSVRAASIANLAARFATWNGPAADRRASIVTRLIDTLEPKAGSQVKEMLEHAAAIVDIGRAVDYYDRFEHAAMLITAADLGGFSHSDLGVLTTILRQADDDVRLGPYRALTARQDRDLVLRAATVLLLADELNRRIPPGRRAEISGSWAKKGFRVTAPVPAGWRPRGVADRFLQVFGRPLMIEATGELG